MNTNVHVTGICAGLDTVGDRDGHVRRHALLISLILHAAVLLLLVYRVTPERAQNPIRFLPVELVTLEPPTTAPPRQPPERQSASVTPQTRRSPPQIIPLPLPGESPSAPQTGSEPVPQPPRDELQSRLEAFAKLALPGNDAITATGNGTARGPSAYDLKDFVRAQVERRWSVDADEVANHNVTVSIHVVLTPDGTIKTAEIVDDQRANASYHSLALSARNAVVLSSPIALPVGTPASALDMILTLKPTDTLR